MNRRPKTAGTRAKASLRRTSRPAASKGPDLASLFSAAAQSLAANQSSLNRADKQNHNHGDNMVEAFNMIAQSMAGEKRAAPSTQLRHASQYLAQNASNGSAHVYAEGLAQAAKQFRGRREITPDNAMMLVQSLLGGGQQARSGGGLSDGLDIGDIINAGMSFMNAKQRGQDNVQAALTALMSAGPMGGRPHRQQSGQLVANALLQALGSSTRRR